MPARAEGAEEIENFIGTVFGCLKNNVISCS